MSKLAINGGTPVAAPETIRPKDWPPRSEATADRLREVYLTQTWSFNGPEEQAFVQEYAEFHGARHGIFMVNGTVTLQAALEARGIGPGDEVILPALTWIATAMAVRYVGATPVIVDIEPTTLCLDPKAVEAALTPRTRAIIPVHLYGGMADLEALLAIASKHDLALIEDCAHMQGGKWNGRGVGSWGDVGSFSFQQSKTLSSGEGGICLTNDDELADKLYRIKHIGYPQGTAQGVARTGPPAGLRCHNFRPTEFQAVILRDQLKDLASLIERYNKSAERIDSRLRDISGVRRQAKGRLASPQGYYAYVTVLDEEVFAGLKLNTIAGAIRAEGGVGGGTYGPVYRHLLWNLQESEYRLQAGGCPVADGIGTSRCLVLQHPFLGGTDESVDLLAECYAKVLSQPDALRDWQAAQPTEDAG